ncbi:threonine aldolase [Caulobacter sp. D4A]|uniref:DSD1 family PLP-dependent enzyme n=1 Tax=unclassified Caulobacter TaxID=2648921 RepID=UPI000D72AB0D|nr:MULTISPECIES: DSD1 family PLP-dependent enzyme [unclassified Caulobacter]PXA93205.1 threonine aldolase [Caulobacter sp. D5]PXA93706.1 threonine aldolase [Caulobacter sp. D4A]
MTDIALHADLVGQQGSREQLNTPVLVLDRAALSANIATMAAFAASKGLKLRPHAKTHKSADIARLQIDAGAVGLCCAKIGEAEALAAQGVTEGLLITSPVVSAPAIARLAALNLATTGLKVVADHPDNVAALGAAAAAAGKPLEVVIDLDPGIHRTGVASAEAAVALFEAITAQPALTYAGLQCYCGVQQHIEAFDLRKAALEDRGAYIREVIAALTAAGGAPPIVSGSGTGSHRIDAELSIFTELQVGSYVFMDDQYLACDLAGEGAQASPYQRSLVIDARVVSANSPGMVTVDAGFKSMSTDADPPQVVAGAPEGSRYFFMGDEHGALVPMSGSPPPLGARVTLAVPHCDPTVNLYDAYHVVEGGTLVAIWPVTARGRSR